MIEYAALVTAFFGGLSAIEALLGAAGVNVPPGLADAMKAGLPGVVRLLEAVGCAISGCPKDDAPPAPLPDEAGAGRDAYHVLAAGAAGLKPSGR